MEEFRNRVLLPLLIPLAAAGIIVVVVLNFSQVLLALHDTSGSTAATMLALVVASSVLFGFTYFSAAGEARSNSNITALVGAGMVLVFAGFTGFAAIEAEHEKEAAAEEPALEPELIATAFDIGFRETEMTTAPGEVVIALVNDGNLPHTFLFDEQPGLKLEVGSAGERDIGSTELAAGTYTFFCDIPGHRQAGMEGTLNVVEGAAPGGGGEGEPTGGPEGAATGSSAEVVAKDVFFEPKEISVPSAPVQITLTNEGALNHTLLVDGVGSFGKLEVPTRGATANGTLEAEPGTYTLFCEVPGHRAVGMEATLTIG